MFHLSIEKAKTILESNQYNSSFYEPIIKDTLEKIITKKTPGEKLCFDEKVTGKKLFYIQYSGQDTMNYVKRLIDISAPIMPIFYL